VPVNLVMATLLCASVVPAAAGEVPFAIAREEEASLGKKEDDDLTDYTRIFLTVKMIKTQHNFYRYSPHLSSMK
jgi:hypothetical protein